MPKKHIFFDEMFGEVHSMENLKSPNPTPQKLHVSHEKQKNLMTFPWMLLV